MAERLSALDASFLEAETPSAHMHVGWAALFDPPAAGTRPSSEQLQDHIARRLHRAPRYRQRLAPVPLGLASAAWIDDDRFDVGHHVKASDAGDLLELAGAVMSTPLGRERPLWELWIADALDDGRIGVVGKAHHCMVDGLAAVELASLLLDPAPHPPPAEPDGWAPDAPPSPAALLLGAAADRLQQGLDVAALPARLATSPGRVAGLVARAGRAGRALVHSMLPAAPESVLNEPLSPYRRLAAASRPFEDLLTVKRAFGVTVNDVVLAVATGGVGAYLAERDGGCDRLKAMVPVSVRADSADGQLGNRISFMFLELPCGEPDPERRLTQLHALTAERKQSGEPDGADAVLNLVSYTPSLIQRALTRVVASPRTFNLAVSNIPGPPQTMYLLGCPLREAYPVVPLADRHTLSIGFTTVAGQACFGVYCDSDALPDADRLTVCLHRAVDELIELAEPGARRQAGAPV